MKKNILIVIFSILVVGLGIYIYIDAKNGYGLKKQNIKEDIKLSSGVNVVVSNTEQKDETKVETKVEEPTVETKVEEPKVETKVETKVEEPTVEVKAEEPKVETKVEEPKVEEKQPEEETKESILKEEIVTIKQEPVTYFLAESKSIEEAKTNDEGLKERAKNAFINIIDFIFYDKPINGYRFSELTNDAKLKIIEIALNIDKKIDDKYPAYKDKIKEGASTIKGKLGVKYLEVSAKICDSMGEYKCNLAKESFNNLKKSFSLTVELVKELAKSGSQRVKELYEKFRG